MAKDETVVGITGKPVPKPRTAKQQYELEKKRRMQKHLGKNVGGVQYKSDVNPYYNPRARTFEEFIGIANAILSEAPYQIYGPDPHGSSDSEPKPLGKPYQNKKRAKTRADKLDQEIGGYRHFVRKVDEEGDWWHPDPKIDRLLPGRGPRLRAREDNKSEPDYSNKLKPGETYMQFAKRKQKERMKKS